MVATEINNENFTYLFATWLLMASKDTCSLCDNFGPPVSRDNTEFSDLVKWSLVTPPTPKCLQWRNDFFNLGMNEVVKKVQVKDARDWDISPESWHKLT